VSVTLSEMSYLLAAVSAIATLAGLGFAFYGFYNLKYAERIVERKVESRMSRLKEDLRAWQMRTQEANQKVIAGYALSMAGKHREAATLFEVAVSIDPEVFNGYIALGYEYLSLGEKQQAIEAFHKAASLFPDRPEPHNDLARVYAQTGEYKLALDHIREAVVRKSEALKDIEKDPVFDCLRKHCEEDYKRIVQMRS